MAEQWMSIVEYARTFSISDMTVRRRIKNGKLNAVLKEGKYYIQVDNNSEANEGPRKFDQVSNFEKFIPDSFPMQSSSGYSHDKGGAVKAKENSWNDRSESFMTSRVPKESLPSYMNESMAPPAGARAGAGDISSLISYCERSLTRINSIERHLNDSYKNRLSHLESENKRKDLVIAQLKQQVEDLQILIKMYDKNN